MKKFIIVGLPNSGKTTLLNTITGKNERTGNYSGVTVEAKELMVKAGGHSFLLVDLPGVYSFFNAGGEEKETKNYLQNNKKSAVIFLATPKTIKRNLKLLNEIISFGFTDIKIIINKIDGNGLDKQVKLKLEQELGFSVLEVDVRKNKNIIIEYIFKQPKKITAIKEDLLFGVMPKNRELSKLDKLLMGKVSGVVIFIIISFFVLFISYGYLGSKLSLIIEMGLGLLKSSLQSKISSIIFLDFINKVLFDGIGAVLVFLPQLGLMLTLLYLLDEMGYLPRAAFLFNVPFFNLGLSGKSVFSLGLGVGCTTSSFVALKTIEEPACRYKTAQLVPFVGCSAKLPVVLMLASLVQAKSSVLVICLVYLFMCIVGIFNLKLIKKSSIENLFIAELPALKRPNIFRAIKQALFIMLDLLKKIFIPCLIVSVFVWVLLSVNTSLEFFNGGKPIMLFLAEKISFLFTPLGFGVGGVVAALICGLVAKENIIIVLTMFGAVSSLKLEGVLSLILFVMFYSPCVPAIISAKKIVGKGFALKMLFRHTFIAYIISFVFYTFAATFNIFVSSVLLIIFLYGFYWVLKLTPKCSCLNKDVNYCKKM